MNSGGFSRGHFLSVTLRKIESDSWTPRFAGIHSVSGNSGITGSQSTRGATHLHGGITHALTSVNRTARVRHALDDSPRLALQLLDEKYRAIQIEAVASHLISGCLDLGLVLGSKQVTNVGTGLLGVGNTTDMPRLLATFWGLQSIAPMLGAGVPTSLSDYGNAFNRAWGPRYQQSSDSDRLIESSAARDFAYGHVVAITALLMGLVAYAKCGHAAPSELLMQLKPEVLQSQRLGIQFSQWLEQNQEAILAHPLLNRRAVCEYSSKASASNPPPIRGTPVRIFADFPAPERLEPSAKPLHWIEIELVGENDCAIPWEEYELLMPDGSRCGGVLDENGIARVENIENPGNCSISFPKLDRRAWDWKAAREIGENGGASVAKPSPDRDWKPRTAGTGMVNTLVKIGKAQNVHSLAFETGHTWSTIWNHPENSAVRKQRLHPEVLSAGDSLFIPPIDRREETGATDKCHQFRRLGVPSIFRFRPLFLGEPFANQPYRVSVDTVDTASGITADTGLVECHVRPDATEAIVVIGSGYFEFTYRLGLRGISPFDTSDGIEQRLNQLGYFEGGQSASEAITAFQDHHGLKRSGNPDSATLATLLREFGR